MRSKWYTVSLTQPMPQWSSRAQGIPRWSDRRPKLLRIEAELWAGDECLDVQSQPLGLRRLERDGVGLRLNGKPIYLRGVCEHAYFAETYDRAKDLSGKIK